jgi:hypothetical protein
MKSTALPSGALLSHTICEDDGKNCVSHSRLTASVYFVRKLSWETDWAFPYLRYILHPNPSFAGIIFGVDAPVIHKWLLRHYVNHIASFAGFENCATRVIDQFPIAARFDNFQCLSYMREQGEYVLSFCSNSSCHKPGAISNS